MKQAMLDGEWYQIPTPMVDLKVCIAKVMAFKENCIMSVREWFRCENRLVSLLTDGEECMTNGEMLAMTAAAFGFLAFLKPMLTLWIIVCGG